MKRNAVDDGTMGRGEVMTQEVDAARLGILGVSEGANIAAMVAADAPSIRAEAAEIDAAARADAERLAALLMGRGEVERLVDHLGRAAGEARDPGRVAALTMAAASRFAARSTSATQARLSACVVVKTPMAAIIACSTR